MTVLSYFLCPILASNAKTMPFPTHCGPLTIGCTVNEIWTETWKFLTHRGRVMHICVNNLTITGSDNGLSPGRHQPIIWTNAGRLLIWIIGTNFSEILSAIHIFSFKKMHLKMSPAEWRTFCLCLNVVIKEILLKMLSAMCPPFYEASMCETHFFQVKWHQHSSRKQILCVKTFEFWSYPLVAILRKLVQVLSNLWITSLVKYVTDIMPWVPTIDKSLQAII